MVTQPRPSRSPPNNPNLRNIESYTAQWQEVITNAKCSFRAYVAGTCGFPDGANGLGEAKEHLEDAVQVYLEEGGMLERGNPTPSLQRRPLT